MENGPIGDSQAHVGNTLARLALEAESISVDDPRRIRASLAMFDQVSKHWKLRENEREKLLGGVSKSTWSEWRQRSGGARLRSDTRERIANLFAIDLNAHSIFAEEFADRWVREPNEFFAGASPLTTMLRGNVEDVITVRRYLEGVRTSSAVERPLTAESEQSEPSAVAYLPGEAMLDEKSAIRALEYASGIYERLSLHDPTKYRAALGAALATLATSLDKAQDIEAPSVLRRAVTMLQEVDAEEPPITAVIGGRDDAPATEWNTNLSRRAASVLFRVGMFDPEFIRALMRQIQDIEREPFSFPTYAQKLQIRHAELVHRALTWSVDFCVDEASHTIEISSVDLNAGRVQR
jgi:uncharacterized protein (DUF2384 family)